MDEWLQIRAILEKVGEALRLLADAVANLRHLPEEARRDLAEEVHRIADEIGE